MRLPTFSGPDAARRGAAALLVCLIFGCLSALGLRVMAADATKSWSGTWNNNKFKTTGELTCTVVGEQNGQWIAKFTGTGLGKPFNYTALVTAKTNGPATTLQGTARIDGDNYQWSGSISGPTLVGSFRSTTGNNGAFRLQTKK
jgi:hypothetical protein